MKIPLFIKSAAFFLLMLYSISLYAQKKQKDIQEHSVFATGAIKVDGKLNDWQDTLQAFNRSALVGYTVANDKKNLYLVIKSSDAINSTKILAGGITFAVNTEGKKKDKEANTITFPVINAVARSTAQRGSSGTPGGQRQMSGGRGAQARRGGSESDSVFIARRKAQLAQFKEIKVLGFKDVKDSLISIYNEYGIKVAASYDAKGSLIYELAVPLNLLDLTIDSKKELAYNIKINGRAFAGRSNGSYQAADSDDRGGRRGGANYGRNQGEGGIGVSFSEPLDFWGKYSLAIQ